MLPNKDEHVVLKPYFFMFCWFRFLVCRLWVLGEAYLQYSIVIAHQNPDTEDEFSLFQNLNEEIIWALDFAVKDEVDEKTWNFGATGKVSSPCKVHDWAPTYV